MPIADLMLVGAELLLLGMGIVFGFLTLLVFTLHGMSRFAAALDRRVPGTAVAGAVTSKLPTIQGVDEELTAVIAAAIARYREDRPR